MSTPNDIQALLASIRPRPSPNGPLPQDHQQYQHHQQYPQRVAQPYQPGMFPPHPQHPQHPSFDAQSYPHPHFNGYHHPSVSSAIHSPSSVHPLNSPPHHGSDILSPNLPTPHGEWNQPPPPQQNNPDRAANLLNLLRFSQGQAPGAAGQPIAVQPMPTVGDLEQSRPQQIQEVASCHARKVSASDLIASFLEGAQAPYAPPVAAAPVAPTEEEGAPSDHTQNMLLRLLNRTEGPTKPPISVKAHRAIPEPASLEPKLDQLSSRFEDFVEEVESLHEASGAKPETVAPPSGSKDSMFTYVNPFDQLAAISPGPKSPQARSTDEFSSVDAAQELDVAATSLSFDPPSAVELAAPQNPQHIKSPVLEEGQRRAVHEVVSRLVDEIGISLAGGEAPAVKTDAETSSSEDLAETAMATVASRLRESLVGVQEAIGLSKPVEMPQVELPQVITKLEVDSAPSPSLTEKARDENAEALADSWESAEDSAEKDEERVVSVQNFPLRPFISITVKPNNGKLVAFRDDGVMDIARLKKEFDQLDRSLTSATSDYIVYALPKTGGIRIIRQDDGSDRQVFRSTRDRIFNVALCNSQYSRGDPDMHAILGIGVSGTVYWSLISRQGKDLFETDALESESLVFPPYPASDENTSGGQLKTRAKRSSRHTDIFAIGRGKNIYVVSAKVAKTPEYEVFGKRGVVDTAKYFKERALKISTGKAGKDFVFSHDDSVIASLDKTGRLRFWDIQESVARSTYGDSTGISMNEVRVPLNTFVTGSPAEKSWPTSVLFVDKLRPYSKHTALRYVLVGLKQNHTLQLWDIGLGKAVEEVKFPHENESDAICSVAYHPSSGIIAVGHPTRNSIYFVHLSVPRYNLANMSQAAFIKAAAANDGSLEKPDSTACLSGIREISLGSKGQLRSLELLPIVKSETEKEKKAKDNGMLEEEDLFELYVMHSHGVTCMNIKREDLGWNSQNRVISPIDAQADGSIEITDLQSFPSYITDDPSVNGDVMSNPSRTTKETVKKQDVTESVSGVVHSRNISPSKGPKKKLAEEQAESFVVPTHAEKSDKKKKKKASSTDPSSKLKQPTAIVGVEPLQPLPPSHSHSLDFDPSSSSTPTTMGVKPAEPGATRATTPSDALTLETRNLTPTAETAASITPDDIARNLDQLRLKVTEEFNTSLDKKMDTITRLFKDERSAWDTASDKKMQMVLEGISTDMDMNVNRIVEARLKSDVVPAITQIIEDKLTKDISTIVNKSLRDAGLMNDNADAVLKKVRAYFDTEFVTNFGRSISPLVDGIVNSQKTLYEANTKISRLEKDRVATDAKLGQMESMIRSLTISVDRLTVASLTATENGRASVLSAGGSRPPAHIVPTHAPVSAQVPGQHQGQIQRSVSRAGPISSPPLQPITAEIAADLNTVRRLCQASGPPFEDAIMTWMHSQYQADLFDHFFSRVDPAFLGGLPGVMVLSVASVVTASFSKNIEQRLHWLQLALHNVNPRDEEVADVAGGVLLALAERLNNLYMKIVAENPQDPLLRRIPHLARRVRELQGAVH
ncbi:hypothetical protein N7493_001255 [Penicillium malachiteum]|uniref:EDC4-like protein pdc1 beta-propeller domain-containing protein n=1 Tax=Penicillium malachiteum TaxID=1324776 RepID=A0AAD6HTW6_9EURO|nr:hypothetical protein N7493_001255 [Penicillium malachiteum]